MPMAFSLKAYKKRPLFLKKDYEAKGKILVCSIVLIPLPVFTLNTGSPPLDLL